MFRNIFITLLTACAVAVPAGLRAEKHWVPGMGTYGVSNEKRTCSVCGTIYTAGEGHMCERPDRATHHSSSSSSSGSSYDADIYVPAYTPAYTSPSPAPSASASSSSNSGVDDMVGHFPSVQKIIEKQKKKKAMRKKIIWGCVIGGIAIFWLLRRRRK